MYDYDYITEDGTTYTEFEAEHMFRNYLDEEGTVSVAGLEFYPSVLLEHADPTAYRVTFADWRDSYGLDEYHPGHEWEVEDEDEDEDEGEYTPECEYCATEVTSDEVTISLARHARIMCKGCGNFEV